MARSKEEPLPAATNNEIDTEVAEEQNLDMPVQETFDPIVEIHNDLNTPPPNVQETVPPTKQAQEPAGIR